MLNHYLPTDTLDTGTHLYKDYGIFAHEVSQHKWYTKLADLTKGSNWSATFADIDNETLKWRVEYNSQKNKSKVIATAAFIR